MGFRLIMKSGIFNLKMADKSETRQYGSRDPMFGIEMKKCIMWYGFGASLGIGIF